MSKWLITYLFDPEFFRDSLSHLSSCFVGKRNTKNTSRIDMKIWYHMNDSFGDCVCFSRSSSGIYEEWSVDGIDGDLLLWVEFWHAESVSKKWEKSRENKKRLRNYFYKDIFLPIFLFIVVFLCTPDGLGNEYFIIWNTG